MSNILSGKANVGFDIFIAMHRKLMISADALLGDEPRYRTRS